MGFFFVNLNHSFFRFRNIRLGCIQGRKKRDLIFIEIERFSFNFRVTILFEICSNSATYGFF